ncbi:MAG: Bax inhibitor-1/YccA family protein [Propionibacteriaceae bacterium]|nr:Bax inhibitor-1/YccA family protein [Propionibacteriaceae bacterium]
MANPVFSRSETFNRPPQPTGYGYPQQGYGQPQPGYGYPQPGQVPYGQYGQDPYAQPGAPLGYQQQPTRVGGVMTMDDVLAKTAIALLVVFAVAAATFFLVPPQLALPAAIAGGVASFVCALVVGMRATISPVMLIIYALLEGVFVGGLSKFFEFMWPGIVMSAVLATFVTAGATLAVYKFFNIRVSGKFRKMVTIATLSFAGVMLVNFVLNMFGIGTGLREIGSGAGWLSIGVSVLAVCLAVFNLVLDFDFIERGIAAQAPASESWRAAFGVTVTMVWLYVEILRILSYFQQD